MGFLSLIPLRTWLVGISGALVVASIVWGILALRSDGYESCEQDHLISDASKAEESHQEYLASVEKGEELSAELLKTQRRLDATKAEYLQYANAIVGVCDPSFRVFVEHASGAKAGMPEAPGAPVTATAAESAADRAYEEAVARAMGQNITENYSRLDKCVAEFGALIEWHNRHKEILK